MRYVALLASSRSQGHTRGMLEYIASGHAVKVLDINDYRISPYSYSHLYENDDFHILIEPILDAEVLLFATPVYWYTMSAQLKVFFDRLTDLIRYHRELRGRLLGKLCFVITTSESPELPPGFDLPFVLTCNYLGMTWGGSYHAYFWDEWRPSRRAWIDARRFARTVFTEE